MNVKAIPSGYSSVTPYLIVEDATEAIEFYKQVFGATERMRLPLPGGEDRACGNSDRRFRGHAS